MKKLSLFLLAVTMILVSCKPDVEKPTVVTESIGEITKTTAKITGLVTADGGAEVTERGICWSTDGTPTILDYHIKDMEGGLGSYDIFLIILVPNTQYYVRAYATNEVGTSYGDERIFTTLEDEPEEPDDEPEEPDDEPEEPVVTTAEITEITVNSAICGGEVLSEGDAVVMSRGICWNTEGTPTLSDTHTVDGGGAGIFTSNLTDLNEKTTYYVRAYATNEVGTSYGDEVSFTTLERTTINGHEYVDLGLPSGLKWATCNVGASSAEDYGDYFAWGETSPKAEYEMFNYQHWNDLNGDGLWGYGESTINSDISGNAQYDAATANWGSSWRMPTKDECHELVEYCEWEWVQVNGVNGARVMGPNGNSIFIPAAGYRSAHSLYDVGEYGFYWSSTPDDNILIYYHYAYDLMFNDYSEGEYHDFRFCAKPVRPVSE